MSYHKDPGTWIQDPEAWIQKPGSKSLDPGAWTQEPGVRSLGPGAWILGAWIQEPGSRTLDPGSCFQVSGSRVQDSGAEDSGPCSYKWFQELLRPPKCLTMFQVTQYHEVGQWTQNRRCRNTANYSYPHINESSIYPIHFTQYPHLPTQLPHFMRTVGEGRD